jgi:hypothetical protein
MRSLARYYVYLPGMDHDIEEMVRVCGPCAAAAAAKQPFKETLHSWPPVKKTVGAHSHKIWGSTSGKALHRHGRLLKVPRGHFSAQYYIPADSCNAP